MNTAAERWRRWRARNAQQPSATYRIFMRWSAEAYALARGWRMDYSRAPQLR